MSRGCLIVLPLLTLAFPLSSARASQLVPQTWLPGIEIATRYGQYLDEVPRPARVDASRSLVISEQEFQQRMLPTTFRYPFPFTGTYVWGFGAEDSGTGRRLAGPSYPGPTVVAQRYPRGDPRSLATIFYDNRLAPAPGKNNLVLQEYLTVDQTLHWANPLGNTSMEGCMDVTCTASPQPSNPACCQPYLGPVPVTVHLHGAETPSAYDGHPDTWWTPGVAITGPSFVDNRYTYVNTMEPATLWYHDHALGMTRINIYSGLAGFYFIRGDGDTGVERTGPNLPAGKQELELAIADRQFDTNGQLFFPDGSSNASGVGVCGDLTANDPCLNGPPPNPDVHPFWNPEFFGDVIVVNGIAWPKMGVSAQRYRFRVLNASNARFYNLKLAASPQPKFPDGKVPVCPTPPLWVIGSDGGLLDRPVRKDELLIGPSMRYDVVVDFAGLQGCYVEVTNSANAPYPGGDPPDPRTNGKVMRFQVGPDVRVDKTFNPAAPGARLRGMPGELPKIVRLADGHGGLAPGVQVDRKRQLVLVEIEGPGGPLEVLLNNTKWSGKRFGLGDPVPGGKQVGAVNITELPVVGSTELWEIVNLTEDAHPIHVHLGQFQLVNRQPIDPAKLDAYRAVYDAAFPGGVFVPEYGPPMDYGTPNSDGALGGNPAVSPFLVPGSLAPNPEEFGWKDTWTVLPGQVTRIAVRVAPQDLAVAEVEPGDNFFAFDPTATLGTTDGFGFPGGPGYIWHCHILDHEDNEMMRPYIPVNLDEAQ